MIMTMNKDKEDKIYKDNSALIRTIGIKQKDYTEAFTTFLTMNQGPCGLD